MSSRNPSVRTSVRFKGLHRRVLAVVSMLVMIAVLTPLSAAHASSRLATCFSYGGQRWQGISTYLEYWGVDSRWHPLNGTESFSRSNGCIAYYPASDYRGYSFRVHAVGLVPHWRGFFNGVSPTYAPGGDGSYNLGETRLNFYFIPPSWPTEPSTNHGGLTSDWLDDMAQGCRAPSSAAANVACYMDRNGLVGNVVVPYRDTDDDGFNDAVDNYPTNPRYN
jgi:hypothetical protein